MYNNNSEQLLPYITPELLTRYPDQTCDILNRLIRIAQAKSTGGSGSGGEGNLEDIVQTTTSYADGGVNIVTAYLSDGTTQDFQIRNGHQGSQGDPGNPGAPGADGQDATIAVGTTTTLPAGSSATVTNTGTPSAAVLNFGIPKGSKGDPGDAATIAAGTTTTLSAGSSATVTNSGTSSAAVFDFGIPRGADGQDGVSPVATVTKAGDTATITITDANGTTTASVTDGTDGTPGAAATIAAGTVTTLSPGSSATVTNSGTSSAAVFNFGIPQGATGSAGPANTLSIGTVQSGVTADATITGTSPNQTLNLTLPQGSPGTAATITAGSVTTLSPGSSATVTNSGTSTAAVFDFGIPQGAPGQDANVINVQSTTSTTDAYSAKYTEDHFQAKDSVYTFTKTLSGTSQSWTDTGITNSDLPTGTYAMQVEATSGKIGMWNPVYSATIAWQNYVSNDARANEILLMHMGHADNGGNNGQRLFLRVLQQTGANPQKLQYAFRNYYNDTTTATFTFRRLI